MVGGRARGRGVVAGVCLGAAIGVAFYRVWALPFDSDSPWQHSEVLVIALVLVVAAFRVGGGEEPWRWRPRWAVAVVVPATVVVTLLIGWWVHPPWHFEGKRRQFPGFSLVVPAGDEKHVKLDYAQGTYGLEDIGDDGVTIDLGWHVG